MGGNYAIKDAPEFEILQSHEMKEGRQTMNRLRPSQIGV
jgi:hypothetical protein